MAMIKPPYGPFWLQSLRQFVMLEVMNGKKVQLFNDTIIIIMIMATSTIVQCHDHD